VKSIANETGEAARVVIVQLKSAVGATCGCSSEIEQAICGCSSRRLPGLWAFAAGSVTLAGTSLTAAQPFWGSAPRGNTLLVAITSVRLQKASGTGPNIGLKPGGAQWIPQGRHEWRLSGATPARFITVEF
jgi:hypothetical protein